MVVRLHVDLVGWPFKDSMRNTSLMGHEEIRLLHSLVHANPPKVYYIKLTNEEVAKMIADRRALEDAGETVDAYIPNRAADAARPPPSIEHSTGPVEVAQKKKPRKDTVVAAASRAEEL